MSRVSPVGFINSTDRPNLSSLILISGFPSFVLQHFCSLRDINVTQSFSSVFPMTKMESGHPNAI